MATYQLTTGIDWIVGTSGNDTVYATSATLNSWDHLIGGGGVDTLVLNGGGTFHVDQLVSFSGFSTITYNNGSASAELYLGNQAVSVTKTGTYPAWIYLGTGAATVYGNAYSNYVVSNDSNSWNTNNAFYSVSSIDLDGTYYDLTANKFSNVGTVYVGYNTTIKISTATAEGISYIGAPAGNVGPLTKILTADATLDLSHLQRLDFKVQSANTSGTIFTIDDASFASNISGGSGQDTIVAQGFNFTAAQRDAIFQTASIETLIETRRERTSPSGFQVTLDRRRPTGSRPTPR